MKPRIAPSQLENPDFEALKSICKEYIEYVAEYGGCDTDDDYDQYIFEAAISALYSDEIWDFINLEDWEQD